MTAVSSPPLLANEGSTHHDRSHTSHLQAADRLQVAPRQHALGIDALEQLAGGEPLWRVRECVFAVLAMESEPVDPRL